MAPAPEGTAPPALPAAALREPKKRRGARRPPGGARHRAERAAFVVVRAILGALPLRVAYGIAEAILLLAFRLTRRYRSRALASLEIAYGEEASAAWREGTFRESSRQLAWQFVEGILGPRLLRDPRRRSGVDLAPFESVLRRDGIGDGRSALLVSSHQGSPEVASLAAALAGRPHAAVVRPFDNPYVWSEYVAERAAIGRETLAKEGALWSAYRRLKKGGLVALQIDQDSRGAGVFVPYFGTLAYTHTGAAELAIQSGAPVYLVACVRTARRRFRHRVACEGPFFPERTGDRPADVLRFTARLTEGIERMARAHPEQVLWVHRRWKRRPEGAEAPEARRRSLAPG